MLRKARIDAPGALHPLHHIVMWGIERKSIFKDSLDFHLLSDQAMLLCRMKKSAKNSRFSDLGIPFQGQKHGCKDSGVP